MAREGIERRLTTIMSADVVGYSRLMAADHWKVVMVLVRRPGPGLAEGVEQVPRVRIIETMIQNPGRC